MIDDDEKKGPVDAWRMAVLARICMVKVIGRVMEMEYLHAVVNGVTEAKTMEDYFGFAARDVSCVHRYHLGIGRGVFFRLYEGRVIDAAGKAQNPDRALYDPILH